MKRLHELLENLTNASADIDNLRTVLRIVEWSADTGEEELRAVVNVAMLCLAALKEQSDSGINVLDTFLLEQWHKDCSLMSE